jgi:UDP-GlcNAc:undecaprenyl-phosphate GlcNAc-1-phosphate transferase
MAYLVTFFFSLLVALIAVPILIYLAKKYDFLDYPSGLKTHPSPTPLMGGLGVFGGFLVAILLGFSLFHLPWDHTFFTLILIGGLIVLVGLWDDRKGLAPSIKFFWQVVVAFVFLIFSGKTSVITGSGWDILVLLLWIVGLMNALNFLDAMDGLCGGVSFILTLPFLFLAFYNHRTPSILISLAFMGALLGFLRYNFHPAKIFLGDAGSMFNGFILAVLGILFVEKTYSYSTLLVPVLILSYPIFDISFVTLLRAREGRKIYIGDYDNSPRRIFKMALDTIKTVLWIYLICLLLGGIGILVFFFFESPLKMLLSFLVGLVLIIFGIHLHRRFLSIKEKIVLILCDSLLINLVLLFFFWLKFRSGVFAVDIFVPFSEYVIPSIWITIYWLNLFAVLGLYDFSSDTFLWGEWKRILKAIGMGICIFIILSFNSSYLSPRSWLLFIIYGTSLLLSLGLGRTLIIFLSRKLYSSKKIRRKAIIVGVGENAVSLQKKLDSNPSWGYELLGFVACDNDPHTKGLNILGDLENLDQVLRANPVQDILIAVDSEWKGSLEDITGKVGNVEVNIKIIPELKDLIKGNRVEKQANLFLLKLYPSHLRTWEWGTKRLVDFLSAFLVLTVFSPLWIIISLLIKIFIGSPVIIKKECVGVKNRVFALRKFRVTGSEKNLDDRPFWSAEPENVLGRFLRNSKIEKVPMFFNVMKGEMSLIGPKIADKKSFEKLSFSLPFYERRFYVKPGILSLAGLPRLSAGSASGGKVESGRGWACPLPSLGSPQGAPLQTLSIDGKEEEIKEIIDSDIFYVENISLFLDLKIFLQFLFSPILLPKAERSRNA